jgi:hypothetical protein
MELFKENTVVFKAIKRAINNKLLFYSGCLTFFILLGITASITTKDEYLGEVVVLTENGSSSSINLAGLNELSGLLGGKGNSNSNGIMNSEMYQGIIESQPFLSELVSTKFRDSKNRNNYLTLQEYFKNGEKRNFISKIVSYLYEIPDTIQSLFRSESKSGSKINDLVVENEIDPSSLMSNEVPPIVMLDNNKLLVMNIVKNRINLEVKGAEVTISAKMPDQVLSAQVCKLVLEKLIEYVTKYKTNKLRDNLKFLELRKQEAETNYKRAQLKVSGFKDNSLGLIFQSVQMKETVLQNDVNLTFNIYNQVSSQYEQAKIDLKKETPLFSALNPIEIPNTKADPIVWKILFKYFSIGVIFCLIVLVYDFFLIISFVNADK